MFLNRRWVLAGAGMLTAVFAAGCSTQKYKEQIDAQKAEIEGLRQKNYQLELAVSQKQALADELARRGTEAPQPGARGGDEGGLDTTPAVTRRRPAAPTADAGRLRGKGFPVTEVDGYPAIQLPGDIFDLGKATLTAKGKEELKHVAAVLASDYRGHSFRVDGHTDNQPVKKHKDLYRSNWDLSALRACSVAEYLIESGHLDPKHVSVAGFADNRPRDSNTSASGRQKNRRAEIVIVD